MLTPNRYPTSVTSVYIYIYRFIYLFICLFIYVLIYLFIYLCIYLFIYVFIYYYLSICLFVYTSALKYRSRKCFEAKVYTIRVRGALGKFMEALKEGGLCCRGGIPGGGTKM